MQEPNILNTCDCVVDVFVKSSIFVADYISMMGRSLKWKKR